MRSFLASAPPPSSTPSSMTDGFHTNGAGKVHVVTSPAPDQPPAVVEVGLDTLRAMACPPASHTKSGIRGNVRAHMVTFPAPDRPPAGVEVGLLVLNTMGYTRLDVDQARLAGTDVTSCLVLSGPEIRVQGPSWSPLQPQTGRLLLWRWGLSSSGQGLGSNPAHPGLGLEQLTRGLPSPRPAAFFFFVLFSSERWRVSDRVPSDLGMGGQLGILPAPCRPVAEMESACDAESEHLRVLPVQPVSDRQCQRQHLVRHDESCHGPSTPSPLRLMLKNASSQPKQAQWSLDDHRPVSV